MTIELSGEQLAALQQTRAVDTPAEFDALLQAARPEQSRVVREIHAPNQPIPVTLTELRDLHLTVTQHAPALDVVAYGQARRELFRDSIRLLETAHRWFGEGARVGAYKPRTVEQVVQASRPWRTRLKAFADQAFVFDQEKADLFADVNSTGTLEEEVSDLRTLVVQVKAHEAPLAAVGLTDAFVQEGAGLLHEAEGRDLLGVLGLRSQEEALTMRNTLLTYATQLAREARAAGVNACFDVPDVRRRFEATSFRHVLRRLKPRRPGPGGQDEGDAVNASNASDASDAAAEAPAAPPPA